MTKFTKPIVIDAPEKDVVFDGIDFTELAQIVVNKVKSLTIKNCRIYGITGSSSNKYWLRVNGDIPMKFILERNFFGDNTGIYNLIEPNAKFEVGTSVSNNYFKKDCCTHNVFSIYNAADNTVIEINKNYFEYCNGGVRIGIKGDVPSTINLSGNIIKEGDKNYPEYDGLVCIQPYGKKTTSFANCTINMKGNKVPTSQIVYAYSGANDTEMTRENVPVVYLNGEKVEDYPILH